MVGWDSSISFMVDGDHTAGIYSQLLGINCAECTAEQVLWSGVMINADLFSDGLLLGAGEDSSSYNDVSVVEPSSWGRIKAALRVRP